MYFQQMKSLTVPYSHDAKADLTCKLFGDIMSWTDNTPLHQKNGESLDKKQKIYTTDRRKFHKH